MALTIPSSSSSSTVTNNSQKQYDVFLSFRGEDTRYGITSHICNALRDKKIETYFDEDSLERGNEISPALLAAIDRSKISVIVFSEQYANSSWCLSELVHIHKCRQSLGQFVLPIFYKVDPSNIRKQDQGSYRDAFVDHQNNPKHTAETVQEWSSALKASADLAGLPYKPSDNKPESALVKEVVEAILTKLGRAIVSDDDFKGLIGMKDHFTKLESLLINGSPKLQILGIRGMPGIGKTTIANAVFSRLSSRFESFYFLTNVRERSEKHGLERLRDELIAELLGRKSNNIGILSSSIPEYAKVRLRRTKVLLVLDDVSERKQLEHLVSDHFGSESRIIVTTRDERVLRGTNIDADFKKYEVALLSLEESLELFNFTTFRKSSSPSEYKDLSSEVVSCLGRNPLAITVFGSHLRSLDNPNKKDWEDELKKLKDVSHGEIQEKLRISYDGLEKLEKKIFLDIACFFKGKKRSFVENILDGCNFHASTGIKILIDKSLVTEDRFNELHMHDLVQQMGWLIVREESDEPGKRSRIWISEDASHIFNNDTGTSQIEGIFLDASKLDEVVNLKPSVFQRMHNLRLLKISGDFKYLYPRGAVKHKVCVEELDYFPRSLTYVEWYGCPLKSLPSNFYPRNLVMLKMQDSQLQELWPGKNLDTLTYIDLSHSINLTQIPNLSRAKNLETLNLQMCTSLAKVPLDSFKNLNKLVNLNLGGCHKIGDFPDRIDSGVLKTLSLSGCLKSVPVIISRSLVSLRFDSTNIVSVPSSIGSMISLKHLSFNSCSLLKKLPSSISQLNRLENLSLKGCPSLEAFPVLPSNINKLLMSGTAIKEVPSSCFEHCSYLYDLSINNCKELECLPSNIFGSGGSLSLNGCPNLKNLPEIPNLAQSNLMRLQLSGSGITYLPSSIEKLTRLGFLYLDGCSNLELVDNLPMSNLTKLDIENSKMLQRISQLPLSVKDLNATGCTSLEIVTDSTLNEFRSRFWDKPRKIKSDAFDYSRNRECLKLKQSSILTQFQLRVLDMATRIDPREGEIITRYSGNKIPEWFNHRPNNDSPTSFTAVLCPDFLGFALCAVIKPNSRTWFKMDLKTKFRTGDLVSEKTKTCIHKNCDEVVLWYPYPNGDMYPDTADDDMYPDTADEVSFEFSVKDYKDGKGKEVSLEWGVHVVCWNDVAGLGLPDRPIGELVSEFDSESGWLEWWPQDSESEFESEDETCDLNNQWTKENDDNISPSPLKKQRL